MIAPSTEIVGGQAIQASRLLAQLSREPALQMTFVPINPPFPDSLRWARNVRYLRTFINFFVFFASLMRQVPRHDILHVFTAAYTSFYLWTVPAILSGLLFGKKIIVNYRDGRAEGHLQHKLAVWLLARVHAIITPSGYLVDVFARFGLKAQSIFNVIDTSRFCFRLRANPRPVFLTNRGLEPLYNVDCLLRAFAIIQRRYKDATLTIAHDGPCRSQLEELVAQLNVSNVVFAGQIPHQNIPDSYAAADIYMMSPNIDNMPGSILECYASGLPVISTKAGGVPYIVMDRVTGLLVELNDHEALAARAFELLETPGLAATLSGNGARECAKYAWTVIGPQWVRLYAELAGVSL